jgi:ribosomal protein S18 acetylase RimI-like enzyme
MSPPDGTPAARPRIAPRLARRSDLPGINDLNAAAYASYRTRMDRLPAPVSHDYTSEIEAGQAWVILDPAERPALLGMIVLIPADDSLLIENVAVAPAAQGRGLGRQLMEFAEHRAAAQGISRLTLYTNEVMTENLAIYAKLGYRETGRRPDGGYNRVFMEKRLVRARRLLKPAHDARDV